MAKKDRDTEIASLKSSLEDIKLYMRLVYEMVGVGVQENKDTTSDIRYISNQINCHDSRIDNHEHDLRELMGIVAIIISSFLFNKCNN